MFSQLEASFKPLLETQNRQAAAQIDALTTEVHELTRVVGELKAGQTVDVPEVAEENETKAFTIEELRGWVEKEGRVSDAFEAALEARNPQLLEQLCTIVQPRDAVKSCSQAILLCIVQQLSVDLPQLSTSQGQDVVDRLNLRANWLKECSIKLNSSDASIQQFLSTVLKKVRVNVEKVTMHQRSFL